MVHSLLALDDGHRIRGRLRRDCRRHLPCHARLFRPSHGGRAMSARLLVLALACSAAALPAPRLVLTPNTSRAACPSMSRSQWSRTAQVTYQEAKDDDDPLKVQLDAASDAGDVRSGREAGPFSASHRIRPEDRQPRARKHFASRTVAKNTRSSSIIPRTRTRRRCWTGSSASRKPNSTSSIWTAPCTSTSWASTMCCCNCRSRWDRKRLVAPEQFLPLLDRIAKNESFLHMARERAAALAEAIRKPPTPSPEKTQ